MGGRRGEVSGSEARAKDQNVRRRYAGDRDVTTGTCTPAPSRERPTAEGSRPLARPDQRPRLVIADDDPVVQLVLSMSLALDFEVVGLAADGEEAVELVAARQPDAALIDVAMPKGGGVHAAHGILKAAPDTALVMLSGQKCNAAVRQLLLAGAIVYRRKGTDPHALADALMQSIQAHTAERRESAWMILSWYCASLDRRSRRHIRTTYVARK